MSRHEWLKNFLIPDGKIGISFNTVSNVKYYTADDLNNIVFKDNISIYFTPAQHNDKAVSPGTNKSTVLGAKFGWVDVDSMDDLEYTLPPTFIVESGHGYHLYYRYDEYVTEVNRIEQLNQILRSNIPTASHGNEWNANRLLRVINTTNDKIKNDCKSVKLIHDRLDISYPFSDIRYLADLDTEVQDLIRTGDASAFSNDRSRRDFYIIKELCTIGFSIQTIGTIFKEMLCGDKYREHPNPEHYLQTTIKSAQNSVHESGKKREKTGHADELAKNIKSKIYERPNGYFYGDRRLSTFTLKPLNILAGSRFAVQAALQCKIVSGEIEKEITLPKDAFTATQKFNTYLLDAEFSWMGSDNDLKMIWPYMMETYTIPSIISVPVLGLHYIDGEWYYVGNETTLSKDGISKNVAWIPNRGQHQDVVLYPIQSESTTVSKQDVYQYVSSSLPNIYIDKTIWPMIGWYTSCVIKPWIENHNIRFPILNVTGTKGGGKTSLILLMQQLFGQKPKSKEGRTTKFVIISLVSSSNAVPAAFSEFRDDANAQSALYRIILLSYDGQQDARGRGDQTTVEYNLTSPFSVDGEDIISDPAAQERIVIAQTNPAYIRDIDSPYKQAFEELSYKLSGYKTFATYYITDMLNIISSQHGDELYQSAKSDIETSFNGLRNRIRNNHIVTWLGIKLFCEITGCALPDIKVLANSIHTIKDRTASDELAESIVLSVVAHQHNFEFNYDADNNVLYFNLKSAHDWWLKQRKQQGRNTFEEHAIRNQIKEAKWFANIDNRHGMLMYGISIKTAFDCGLDIPDKLAINKMEVQF